MPQLDTSTWFTTVLASSLTLFIIIQIKIDSLAPYQNATINPLNTTKTNTPWELTWTKIYLPLSRPQ